MKNEITLSDHFTFRKLFRFTIMPIAMMVFMSLYSIVDGFFVSNYVNKTAFASLNLVYPFIMIIVSFGFMIGTGGSALVAKFLGEKEIKKANETFSLFVYITIGFSLILAALGFIFAKEISLFLGSTEEMLDYSIEYLRVSMIGVPFFMLQTMFQNFLTTAEKPNLGLIITIFAGISNMVLDYLLVGVFKLGIKGAAIATIFNQFVGGFIPLIYFILPNKSLLRLSKTHFDFRSLLKGCTNGASELLSQISMSAIAFVFNLQLMKYVGEDGVSAYGVICYMSFVFVAIYLGYTIGSSPLVAYNYGARNKEELHNLFKKSIALILILNVILTLIAELTVVPVAHLFVGYNKELFELTKRAMIIYNFAYIAVGFNIYVTSFFTALNNGKISAIIAIVRTLILPILFAMTLPLLFNVDGIWLVINFVEIITVVLSIIFIFKYRNVYGFWPKRGRKNEQ